MPQTQLPDTLVKKYAAELPPAFPSENTLRPLEEEKHGWATRAKKKKRFDGVLPAAAAFRSPSKNSMHRTIEKEVREAYNGLDDSMSLQCSGSNIRESQEYQRRLESEMASVHLHDFTVHRY